MLNRYYRHLRNILIGFNTVNANKSKFLKHNPTFLSIRSFSVIKCWKCGTEIRNISNLFCEKCKFIQNPHEKKNYFKIFEINENFKIDLKILAEKYRKMQSVLHPDKFSNKTENEKIISQEYSSLLNKAYNVLQVPIKRALHLLELKGESIGEDNNVGNPEFLMEIMELNEEISNANEEKLRKLNDLNKKKIEEILLSIEQNFEKNNIKKAKEDIIRMKYYISAGFHIDSLIK